MRAAPAIALAGHYTHDLLIDAAGEHRTLGGSSAYAGAILNGLGAPFALAANVGADFLYAARAPAPARTVPGSPTTAFADDYRTGSRVERCTAICAPLAPGDLPEAAEVGVACGVAGETGLAVLRALRARCRVVVADAQSLLRAIGPDGSVRLRRPSTEALACVDVLKASRTEATALDLGAVRRTIAVIVTEGSRGARLFLPDAERVIPALPAREVDPTGAGDAFLAGLAAGLARGWELERSAALGARCGALAVGQVGIPLPAPGALAW